MISNIFTTIHFDIVDKTENEKKIIQVCHFLYFPLSYETLKLIFLFTHSFFLQCNET